MQEPRPAASLTANLLARRGGARPAMRRAAALAPVPLHEDLGWNDMGDDEVVAVAAEAPAPVIEAPAAAAPLTSPITRQLAQLAERIKATPPAKKTVKPRPATLAGTGRKAAFTLRIDAERHLRLRLLSAMSNRSAQQLLTEALDGLIAQNEQLRDLANRIEAEQSASVADLKWGS